MLYPLSYGVKIKKSLQNCNESSLLMAEEEGFEPPRAVKPLSVFKTDPFSQTWVLLHKYIIVPTRKL